MIWFTLCVEKCVNCYDSIFVSRAASTCLKNHERRVLLSRNVLFCSGQAGNKVCDYAIHESDNINMHGLFMDNIKQRWWWWTSMSVLYMFASSRHIWFVNKYKNFL